MDRPQALIDFPIVISLPVLWGDQDAFGHVNNTVPIRWFESARIAYLEVPAIAKLLARDKVGPILAAVTCNYRRQIRYPDRVWIGARVNRLGRSSFGMLHAVWSESQDAFVADGESTIVMFDYAAQRSTPLQDEFRHALTQVEGRPIEG